MAKCSQNMHMFKNITNLLRASTRFIVSALQDVMIAMHLGATRPAAREVQVSNGKAGGLLKHSTTGPDENSAY